MCLPRLLWGQQTAHAVQQGIGTKVKNYHTFSGATRHINPEAIAANMDFANHPELGMLYADAPVPDCFELLRERTQQSKTFIREGSGGKEIMLQTSTDAMHYKTIDGQWRTITAYLQPAGADIYAAANQPVPVTVNHQKQFTMLGNSGSFIKYNNQLELVYRRADGREKSLGTANWENHSAGDDGVYITDAWPGIDVEMTAVRGGLKTNFIVKHAMPQYAGGQLCIRDHIEMADGLHPDIPDRDNYAGNISIVSSDNKAAYIMSAIIVYEQKDVQHTLRSIGYDIKGNVLDIVLPGEYLGRPATAYPIVIDPLVTTATLSSVGGSSYSPTKTVGCNYVNAATVPANVKVTDVRWTFDYAASGGAYLLNGGVDFTLGICRSPSVAGFFWFCSLATPGTCAGTNVSIFSDIGSCIPAPSCTAYPLNIGMRFYQDFAATTPCATTYITSASPLTITVFGRTVEAGAISSAGGITSICLGQSVTLSTVANFGVPPYTYSWSPSAASGIPVTFTPPSTTPYTVTVTDACGQTAAAAQTIVVTPIVANTGSPTVCIGYTTTLANSSGPGSWVSSNTAIAVVGATSGVVSGIAPGTAVITFTNSSGCYATTVVTVLAMPAAITGTLGLCAGSTTMLANATPGGAWSTSAAAVASVIGTGAVSGVSSGTATITYSTSPGCIATAVVTVFPTPAYSATSVTNPTGCGTADGTIIFDGLIPGITYTVNYNTGTTTVTVTVTTTTSGQIVIAGLTAGIYSGFVITSPDGCYVTHDFPFTLMDAGAPPAPVAGNNSPVCDGWPVMLTASGTPGASYSWSGPGGFTSTLQNPVINPATLAAGGVYTVTATVLGCVSLPATTTVTIKPLPQLTAIKFTHPLTCGGNEGTIILEGLVPGAPYNVGFTYNGAPYFIALVADSLGVLTVSGLYAGVYTNIFTESASCVSNILARVTLIDPPPPPPPTITTNAPICAGLTLMLYGNDDEPGGVYKWAGPNGFSFDGQNPVIPFVTGFAQGTYSLTYTLDNCSNTTTADIELQPIIELTDVYADRYIIPYGDSVQLHANGALYYNWTPHNGTIRNRYIPDPWARPRDSIAAYTVHGMNEWGCHDSADITIRVVFDEDIYIPNSFTPNGDGKNDVFRIGKMRFKKLIDFTIYNRWGQEVYHNPYDANAGWDGSGWGRPQDVGVYFYSIIIETASGRVRYFKGDVTLLR